MQTPELLRVQRPQNLERLNFGLNPRKVFRERIRHVTSSSMCWCRAGQSAGRKSVGHGQCSTGHHRAALLRQPGGSDAGAGRHQGEVHLPRFLQDQRRRHAGDVRHVEGGTGHPSRIGNDSPCAGRPTGREGSGRSVRCQPRPDADDDCRRSQRSDHGHVRSKAVGRGNREFVRYTDDDKLHEVVAGGEAGVCLCAGSAKAPAPASLKDFQAVRTSRTGW